MSWQVTDDERSEVAERLRYLADWPAEPMRYAEQLRDELFDEVLGIGERWDYSILLKRLADLMDPTCNGIEQLEQNGVGAPSRYTSHCSRCGQLWDESDGTPRFPGYCPHCGARVVGEE